MDASPTAPRRATTECRLTRIIDGDTIECRGLGRVRLIGIDSPERDQPPFGARATRAIATLLPPQATAQLEADVEARDRYGRLLAYVWFEGRLINWTMVRQGWAVTLTIPPNVQYADAFAAAERRARTETLGLWAGGGFDCRPTDHRHGKC